MIKLFCNAIVNKEAKGGSARIGFATLNEKGYLIPELIPFDQGFSYTKSEPKNSDYKFTKAGLKANFEDGEVLMSVGVHYWTIEDGRLVSIPQEEALELTQEVLGVEHIEHRDEVRVAHRK